MVCVDVNFGVCYAGRPLSSKRWLCQVVVTIVPPQHVRREETYGITMGRWQEETKPKERMEESAVVVYG